MWKEKFVAFDEYCKDCAHFNENEFDVESACYICLEDPVNTYSKKPVNFKEK